MYSETMSGVQLTGHGGVEKLVYRTDLPVPVPGREDVLIEVFSSSVNNTDINTRIGWYSKSILSGTEEGGQDGYGDTDPEDASWRGSQFSFRESRAPIAMAESSRWGRTWSLPELDKKFLSGRCSKRRSRSGTMNAGRLDPNVTGDFLNTSQRRRGMSLKFKVR